MAATKRSISGDALAAVVSSSAETEQGLRIDFRLSNSASRALHYVAEPRGVTYDSVSGRLTVRLNDIGRELIPGAARVRPTTRFVEPGATVEASVVVPAEITRLVPSPDGDVSKVAFETIRVADAMAISVEIAWADTPYYEDTRTTKRDVFPSVAWQQHMVTGVLEKETRTKKPGSRGT